jgi:glucose uptake protein
MLCWGSWANTQKLAGKWRFELFYYDFTSGLLIAAIAAAFTFGSMDAKELTFQDNFLLAGYRKMAWAVASGMVFNLANLLLVAAIAVAGMAVAFSVGIGLALIGGVLLSYWLNPQPGAAFLFSGAGVIAIAVCAAAFAYSFHIDDQRVAAQQALTPDPRGKNAPKKTGARKGVILSILAGLLMGAFYPMIEESKSSEIGVSPYGVMLLFAVGVFATTVAYVPFFLAFPVAGKPLPVGAYFRGAIRQHVMGLLGGILWMTGGLSNVVAASGPTALEIGPAFSYAVGQGSILVSALWGILVWREFRGATIRVKTMLTVMMLLFAAGLSLLAIAPLRGR